MHKIMPVLTIIGAVLSLGASVYTIEHADRSTMTPLYFEFWARIVGIIIGVWSFCYGVYCVLTVIRTVRQGRAGFGSTQESERHKLGAASQYMRAWYSRHNYDSEDPLAALPTEALIQSRFLQHAEREGRRTEQRQQVADAVQMLEVEPGDVVWHEEQPFAQGGFCKVWRVTYGGEVVAAKVLVRAGAQSIRKAEAWMNSVKKEAAIMHRLSACANIVTVLGVFEKADGAVLLMEYASGGSLRDYLHGRRH
jgi:serine/threonine protein kinase